MDIQGRILDSDLVITGKVVRVDTFRSPVPYVLTEHHPKWIQATIEVESVEKGLYDKKNITVFFPSSMDVRWYTSPKFKEGMNGVWILRKSTFKDEMTEQFTALDPLDFHSANESANIRSLVQKLGGK